MHNSAQTVSDEKRWYNITGKTQVETVPSEAVDINGDMAKAKQLAKRVREELEGRRYQKEDGKYAFVLRGAPFSVEELAKINEVAIWESFSGHELNEDEVAALLAAVVLEFMPDALRA